MQKKIFTSLLVSPLAFGAFANINVSNIPNNMWASGGVTGGLVDDNGEIYGGLGAGKVTQTVNVPCPGKYQVAFKSASNLSFEVEGVAAKDIEMKKDGDNTVFTFVLSDVPANGKDIVFTVSSDDVSVPFSFVSSDLQIVYDFDAQKAAMETSLKNASAVTYAAKSVEDLATERKNQDVLGIIKSLKNEADAIKVDAYGKDQKGGIGKQISDMPAESAANAAKLDFYKKNELWKNDKNKIQVQIDDLNARTIANNDKVANLDKNYLAFVDRSDEVAILESNRTAQNNRIQSTAVLADVETKKLNAEDQALAVQYVSDQCQATSNTIEEEITVLRNEVNAQYALAELTKKVDFKPTKAYATIDSEINGEKGLKAKVDAAYANIAAYAKVFGTTEGYVVKLANVCDKAETSILAIISVNEEVYPGVFAKKQAEWLKNVEAAQEAAAEVFNKTKGNIGVALEHADADNAAYIQAVKAIEGEGGIVPGAKKFATDLNAEMTTALATLKTVEDNFKEYAQEDAVNELELSGAQKTEYNRLVEAAKNAIEALRDEIKNEYYAYAFDLADFNGKLKAANDANGEVKKFTDPLGAQLEAQVELNKFIKILNEAPANLGVVDNGVTYTVDLNKLFKTNLEALKAAVKNVTTTTLSDVKTGISQNITRANDLIKALQTAHDAYVDFSDYITWLSENINSEKATKLINGTTCKAYAALYNAINNPVPTVGGKPVYNPKTDYNYKSYDSKWKDLYKDAISSGNTPEECNQKALDLSAEINEYGWETKVAGSFNTYMEKYVDENFQVAQDALDLIVKANTTWSNAANDKSPYSVADKKYNELESYKSSAFASSVKETKYKDCVELVKKLADELWGDVNTKGSLNCMNQNCKEYNAFLASIKGEIGDSESFEGCALDVLQKLIEKDYADSAAKTTYLSWCTAQETILKNLRTTLGTQLESQDVVANNATTSETITGCIDRLKNPGGGILRDIESNENAYEVLMIKAQSTKKTIIENLGRITANDCAESLAESYIKDLTGLRDVDLRENDKKADDAYAAGTCIDEKVVTPISDEYNRIKELADIYYAQFDDAWDGIVKTNNDYLLNELTAWIDAKIQLNTAYVNAITAYNAYAQLPNKGYTGLVAFKRAIEENAFLFNLNIDAEQLKTYVEDYVNNLTKDHIAISEEDFTKLAITDGYTTEDGVEHKGAEGILDTMLEAATAMVKQFDSVAEAYYKTDSYDSATGPVNGILKAAEDKLAAMNSYLADKPYEYAPKVIENLLSGVTANLNAAKSMYAVADAIDVDKQFALIPVAAEKEVGYSATLGYVMGAIADKLDLVLDANLNSQVVPVIWDPVYKDYTDGTKNIAENAVGYIKGFAALATELAGYAAKYNVSAAQTKFDNAKDAAALINTKVQEERKDLLLTSDGKKPADNGSTKSLLTDYEDQLKAEYQKAVNAVADAKVIYDFFNSENTLTEYYTTYSGQISDFGELDTLGGLAGFDYSNASNKVEDFYNAIVNLSLDNSSATVTAANTAKSEAETAIKKACNGYTEAGTTVIGAYEKECQYLADLLVSLREAYNDAYAFDEKATAEYLAKVKECIDGQEALAKSQYGAVTPGDFYKKASALESDISKNIADLNGIDIPVGKPDLKAEALTALNSSVTAAIGTVNSAKNTNMTEQMVKDEYASQYDALVTKLNNLQADYVAAGANVIAQQPYYAELIKEVIGTDLKDLNSEVATAEAQAALYNARMVEWNVVNDEYEDLVKYTDSCGEDISIYFYYELQNAKNPQSIYSQLKDVSDDLLTLYKSRELTGYSISGRLNAITNNIHLYDLKVRKVYGQEVRFHDALSAINSISAWIKELADKNVNLLPGSDVSTKSLDRKVTELTNALQTNQGKNIGFNAGDENADYAQGRVKIDDILEEYTRIINQAEADLDTARESTYQFGDLNNDGLVNVSDLVMMRKLILDGVTFAELLKENPTEAYAANIVGDKQINIADYTALVNIIVTSLDEDNEAAYAMRKVSRASFFDVSRSMEAQGSISIEAVAEENGVRTYAISISNPEAFVGGQLDLRVESTSRIIDVRGAERLDNHDVEFQTNAQTTRVLISSFDNAEFIGQEGVTLYVDVEGYSGLGFENALFADGTAQTYTFANQAPVTTGVDSLYEGAKAVKEAVYDAAGRMMNSVRRGINIIRNSNGTVTKEMHK